MAGQGFAPKGKGQRRNRSEPQRGEWIELQPLAKPVLPSLPKGEWSDRTVAAWKAWRADPATGMYGPAEIQLCVDLAYVYEAWVVEGTAALASELRQRQDGLGLSPKGKQDRRWRVPAEVQAQEAAARTAVPAARRLRAV